MIRSWILILVMPIIFCCLSMTGGWKTLDLGNFKINIPESWKYVKEQGEDSFVGQIVGPKFSLSFDYSSQGFANHLIDADQDYLKSEYWMDRCYFCKKGIIYADKSNEKYVRETEMKKRGITDSSLIKIETEPDDSAKK
jgi:hypothetical protein